jgi:hypothetical protein
MSITLSDKLVFTETFLKSEDALQKYSSLNETETFIFVIFVVKISVYLMETCSVRQVVPFN